MKICIFSDIHGNQIAFQTAFSKIINEKADLNIFLGDLCGYYFEEIMVFEQLRDIPNLVALKGNHDDFFLRAAAGEEQKVQWYFKKYGSSLMRFLKKDHREVVVWLNMRPNYIYLEDLDVVCCHASPWDPLNGYVYPDSDLERFRNFSPSVFLLGHTHYPMHRTFAGKTIINPGSLGQPRDGNWPTYAVLDLDNKHVRFEEIHYDKQQLIQALDLMQDENPYLKDILLREK